MTVFGAISRFGYIPQTEHLAPAIRGLSFKRLWSLRTQPFFSGHVPVREWKKPKWIWQFSHQKTGTCFHLKIFWVGFFPTQLFKKSELIAWGIFQNSTSSAFEVWFRFEESRLVRFRQLLQLGANFSPNCRGKTIKWWWKIWEFPLKVRSSQPRQRDSVDGSDIQWLHHLSQKIQVLSYLHDRDLKFLGDDFHPKGLPLPENGCLEDSLLSFWGPYFHGQNCCYFAGRHPMHPTNPPKPCEILTFWIPKGFGTGPFGMGPNNPNWRSLGDGDKNDLTMVVKTHGIRPSIRPAMIHPPSWILNLHP